MVGVRLQKVLYFGKYLAKGLLSPERLRRHHRACGKVRHPALHAPPGDNGNGYYGESGVSACADTAAETVRLSGGDRRFRQRLFVPEYAERDRRGRAEAGHGFPAPDGKHGEEPPHRENDNHPGEAPEYGGHHRGRGDEGAGEISGGIRLRRLPGLLFCEAHAC